MSPHGRLSQIGRTVALVRILLTGESLDATRAAPLLGVKRPAADRQLRALSSLPGITIERGSRPRRYRFDRFLLGGAPSPSAAIAACFGASLAPMFAGTAYEGALAELREHVHRLTRRSERFKHIDRKFFFHTRGGEVSLPDHGGELDDVIDALLEERPLSFRYKHFDGSITDERVQPLTLVVYDHQFYVIGRSTADEFHAYRFARIKSIRDDSTTFQYPSRAEYDPTRLFSNSFGMFINEPGAVERVCVRLSPRWRTYAETHQWHRSQRARFHDEYVLIELDVRVCPELEAWLLSFGEEAEVLEPATLRTRISERLARASQRYPPR